MSWNNPLEWVSQRLSVDVGIDLGTANTLVCVRDRGIVLNQPSVVAVKKGTKEVLFDGTAVGDRANEMLGKTPGEIEAVRPLRHGVIANPKVTEQMLRFFISQVQDGPRWVKPRVVIAVPVGITAVELRAVINAAERAGARDVYPIPEPMAAGIGCDLPVTEPRGSLIVDIGGGTTEIAVLSLAGIVNATSLRIAGDEMNEAVVSHLRRHHNLMIGERSAERVKKTIGSAWSKDEELSYVVSGRDSVTGLPRSTTVTSIEIREALAHPVRLICEAIRGQLELAPPEISADLVESGLVLVGGGALLDKLPEAIEDHLGLPVRMGESPKTAVARGTGVVLNDIETFKDVLRTDEDI